MQYAIQTENLVVGYDKTIIVPDFNVHFERGKVTSIIGANGCGKSTVLKAVGRIIPSAGGTIIVNGTGIDKLKSKQIAQEMAILPQTPQAPGTLTCTELVSYGRFPYQTGLGRLTKEDRDIVDWALQVTNMYEFKDRAIANLSGGQRQRVWIAMALAQQTGIILLDEPTTYLDLSHQLEVLELLSKLNKEEKTTIIMVLHDLNLASRYSDYLLSMQHGKVFSYGTPDETFTGEMLNACFGIEGVINKDERTGKPVCVSYDLLRKKQ